jgi:FKBP-type peptidyl-prolyl cis-trans isomerase 2
MAEHPRSLTLLAILAIVVIVVGAVGGGLLYEHNHAGPAPGPRTVAVGDNATVNYIGFFGSGPEAGRVFDTSLMSVAVNNESYPKALQFSFRGKGQYTPLGVHVGPASPNGSYTIGNITFGSVVTGFWQGLLGLAVNESRYAPVPPDLGYGPTNPSCLVLAPLTYQVPVDITVAAANFTQAFPGESAVAGTEFPDPTYKWTDLVLSVNATSVVVENLPTVGWESNPSGWTQTVTNISYDPSVGQSEITVANVLTPANAGLIAGHTTGTQVCSTTDFIISAVDPVAGTFTENFNKEVVGQTLDFYVTIVKIYPAGDTTP